ncbi:MAG: transposase [Hymenobacter sp.]|nr:MAG: transposase [Hymenobacter sp.]
MVASTFGRWGAVFHDNRKIRPYSVQVYPTTSVGNAYETLLRNAKAQRSHSRRGECYDNAQAESLWSYLKAEVLEAREWPVFTDLADAQASVADYFDYYNHKRRHSSIGYLKPYVFHQQQLANIT